MRRIQVEDGLSLRFPGRGPEFDEGVEIGVLAAHLAARQAEFTLCLADSSLDQARALADRFGYRVHACPVDDGRSAMTFLTGRRRPKLTLVRSNAG